MTAEEPNFDISAACTGAYYGAETFTAVLTFAEGSKFVFDVTEDLFVFPQGTDADVSVERIGDTQVRLTAVGLPAFTSSSFDIVVRAEAIDSPFAKDVAVHISYAHPYIGDGERTAAEDSLTVTGAVIGGGLKGTENGLSLPAYVAKWATLSQQSYDESANTYSYVLTRTERAKAQGITMQTLLEKIDLTAQLVSRYETFRYTFAAAGAEPFISAETANDFENDTVTVSLSLVGGNFARPLTKDDLTVTGADGMAYEVRNATLAGLDIVFSEYTVSETGALVMVNISKDVIVGADFRLNRVPLAAGQYTCTATAYDIYNQAFDAGEAAFSVA